MSKVTIASAVLAGLALSDRLNELNVNDQKVAELVGDLASSLGSVMNLVEKVDTATGLVKTAVENMDKETALRGLTAIKGVTADLVSDQELVEQAMGLTDEQKAILQLLKALGGV